MHNLTSYNHNLYSNLSVEIPTKSYRLMLIGWLINFLYHENCTLPLRNPLSIYVSWVHKQIQPQLTLIKVCKFVVIGNCSKILKPKGMNNLKYASQSPAVLAFSNSTPKITKHMVEFGFILLVKLQNKTKQQTTKKKRKKYDYDLCSYVFYVFC